MDIILIVLIICITIMFVAVEIADIFIAKYKSKKNCEGDTNDNKERLKEQK